MTTSLASSNAPGPYATDAEIEAMIASQKEEYRLWTATQPLHRRIWIHFFGF